MIIIESQHGDMIIECNRISVIENKILTDGFILGQYDTDERAIKAYYDIKHFIENGSSYDVMEGKTRTMKNKVFKMPQY